MTDRFLQILTFLSAIGSGLMAGLFFAFSVFMMTALSRLPAPQSIVAMQSINVVILNPMFLFVFSGTAFTCLALAGFSFFRLGAAGSGYLLAGSLLYLVGCILVTAMVNVPLNDTLAAITPGTDSSVQWSRYVAAWTPWNHVRSIATLAALAFFIAAFRKMG